MTEQLDKNYDRNMKVLKEIERNVPERLKKNLMRKQLNTDQEETVKTLLSDPHLSFVLKERLQKELEAGDFRFTEEIVDEEIVKELDDYYDKAVKKALKEGRLTSPDLDPFYQKIIARHDALNEKNKTK